MNDQGGQSALQLGGSNFVNILWGVAQQFFLRNFNIPGVPQNLTNDVLQLINEIIQGNGRLGSNPPTSTSAPTPAPLPTGGQVNLQITGGTINARVVGGSNGNQTQP